MLFYQLTMKNFVDYLHDLSMAMTRGATISDSNPATEEKLPVFKSMPLGSWATVNDKVNQLQEDFVQKS